ncbi:hypothetical protein BGZ61DRAFT_9707 [Ilyonectria robusta]|uniref:uncharacterized protein n=1 Tax=Ilyonectria robusta TaxID=1079257 RepID=UPI001E8D6230|nr:uncharacterized protein BGZ61DRAFT_9707 [Ilyonectria robusta]KAH8737128.1 hypothetical protein BGZ61DRAFT_9707 [Ilyonectria robusta]
MSMLSWARRTAKAETRMERQGRRVTTRSGDGKYISHSRQGRRGQKQTRVGQAFDETTDARGERVEAMKWGCGRGWEGGERGGWNGAEGRGAKGYMKNEGGGLQEAPGFTQRGTNGRIGARKRPQQSEDRWDGVEMTVAASGRERMVKGEG